MKKSIATISLGVLITLFSGCESKTFNLPNFKMPDVNIPAFDLSQKKLDRSLPRVEALKIRSSLSQVALEWKPIRDRQIVGYRILRSDGEGGYKLIKIINDPYVSHYTDENLKQSLYNRYLVSAYTNDGRVSLPTAIKVPKNNKGIEPVPFVTAVSGLPNRVKILWRIHPDLRVDSYIIQRSDATSKSWETLATVDKRLSVEYIDTTVKPGITYNYRILAQTRDGVLSQPSKIVSGTSKLLPPPVTGLMATTNLAKKIELIWKPSPLKEQALYKVYASDFADGLYSLIAKTKATHYTDKFDQDGATRFYRVTVVDSDGLESTKQTKPVKGRTLGYLKAPKITSAQVVNNTLELKWMQTDPRTVSYTIYKKYWDGWRAKKIKIVDFKGTAFIDNKIKPDITYTYYVIAVDKDGILSDASRSVNIKIEGKTKKSSWF
jgi:fibronectin type 3 domain-containing protein